MNDFTVFNVEFKKKKKPNRIIVAGVKVYTSHEAEEILCALRFSFPSIS